MHAGQDSILQSARRLAPTFKNSGLLDIVQQLQNLRTSPGLVVVEDLPHVRDPRALIALFGELAGTIVQYPGEGQAIIEIKEQVTKEGERPSFRNSREFYFHTDLSYVERPPSFLFMHAVVNNAGEGGVSLFADIEKAARKLSPLDIAELQKTQFIFPAPPHFKGGSQVEYPILTQDANSSAWFVRFRRDGLRSQTRAGLEGCCKLGCRLQCHGGGNAFGNRFHCFGR